jgi:hypothetical protein
MAERPNLPLSASAVAYFVAAIPLLFVNPAAEGP